MHEQSETVQGRDKQWYNVYGGTQYPLPLLFGFEQRHYPTQEAAVNRAQWRSQMGENQYPTQAPAYGFRTASNPDLQSKALQTVLAILQDPRNSWIGMGAIRGMGPVGRGMTKLLRENDLGGFNLPTSTMRKTPGFGGPLKPDFNPPGGEENLRRDYIGTIEGLNRLAKTLEAPSNPVEADMIRGTYKRLSEGERNLVDKTATGLSELERTIAIPYLHFDPRHN